MTLIRIKMESWDYRLYADLVPQSILSFTKKSGSKRVSRSKYPVRFVLDVTLKNLDHNMVKGLYP